MQLKIMARKDFEGKLKRDPIELLKAIKEHSVSYQETKYPLSSVYDAMRNLVNICQKDDELLIDYSQRFKTASDILKSQLGSDSHYQEDCQWICKTRSRIRSQQCYKSGSSMQEGEWSISIICASPRIRPRKIWIIDFQSCGTVCIRTGSVPKGSCNDDQYIK